MLGDRKIGLYLIDGSTHHHYTIEGCLWEAGHGTKLSDGGMESVRKARIFIPYEGDKLLPPNVWEEMADKSEKYTLRGNRKDYAVKDDKTLAQPYPKCLKDPDVVTITDVHVFDFGSRMMWCIELLGV